MNFFCSFREEKYYFLGSEEKEGKYSGMRKQDGLQGEGSIY